MSNAKQILAMLRSRAEGDDAQFYSIALQVAASEARQGHRDTANELRSAVDAARGAGDGTLDFAAIFSGIEGHGYDGLFGAEYMPRQPTLETLGWMQQLARRG